MIILIDNYDSFTFNLVHYLGGLGAEVAVHRNDKISVDAVMAADPEAIVLSPGPCTPNEAGICLDLIKRASDTVPILGVCLGHQAIGQAFGGDVVRAPVLVHGKLSEVTHTGRGIFRGINGSFKATRYHSLVVDRKTMPVDLTVTAETADRLVMALSHASRPVHGVQFHPESIASEHGRLMLKNFLELAADWNAATGRRAAVPRAREPAARETSSILLKPAPRAASGSSASRSSASKSSASKRSTH
jgi:anthranilate synthase component II